MQNQKFSCGLVLCHTHAFESLVVPGATARCARILGHASLGMCLEDFFRRSPIINFPNGLEIPTQKSVNYFA